MAEQTVKVGMMERLRGWASRLPIGVGRKVDHYLTANLPRLISEYKLATGKDIEGVDTRMGSLDTELDRLEAWKEESESRAGNLRVRIEVLENKHGLGGA